MATASTLATIRTRLARELGLALLIQNGAPGVTAIAASSFTSTGYFQNTNWGAGYLQGRQTLVYRPTAATSADYLRPCGALTPSSGVVAQVGATWSDTTLGTETIELWYDNINPTREILDAINRAMEFVFFDTFVAISHGGDLDFDMAVSTDTNWTDVGTPTTSAKSTTARRTPYGLRSYNLIGDAVGEGTQSATIPVTQGRQIKAFAIASVNSGTATFGPYDVTNAAVIGTVISHSEEEPQLMQWQGSAPATCKEMALQGLGSVNPSDIFWNMMWLYKQDNKRVNLPAYVSESFMAPSIFEARPQQSTGTGTYDAQSLDFVELSEGRDYTYLSNQPDANPHAILMRSGYSYDYPLFVQARRPYSDLITFSAETDSTACPLHLLMPAIKMRVLLDVLIPKQPTNTVWPAKYAEAKAEWDKANAARPVPHIARRPSFQLMKA